MILLKSLNIALRFILEICGLFALGYWGFHLNSQGFIKYIAGIGIPVIVIVIWGAFGSPAALFPLSKPLRYLLEITIFASVTIALWSNGHMKFSVTYAMLSIINNLLLLIWKQ